MGKQTDNQRTRAAPEAAITTGNDAVLLALAAQYRAAWDAYEALDGVAHNTKSNDAARTIKRAEQAHYERSNRILAAICSIPAEGLLGALVQLEAGSICVDRALATDADDGEDTIYRWATWSIARVLRGVTGRAGFLVEDILPDIDPFELDAAAVIARSVALAEKWAAAAEAPQ